MGSGVLVGWAVSDGWSTRSDGLNVGRHSGGSSNNGGVVRSLGSDGESSDGGDLSELHC